MAASEIEGRSSQTAALRERSRAAQRLAVEKSVRVGKFFGDSGTRGGFWGSRRCASERQMRNAAGIYRRRRARIGRRDAREGCSLKTADAAGCVHAPKCPVMPRLKKRVKMAKHQAPSTK